MGTRRRPDRRREAATGLTLYDTRHAIERPWQAARGVSACPGASLPGMATPLSVPLNDVPRETILDIRARALGAACLCFPGASYYYLCLFHQGHMAGVKAAVTGAQGKGAQLGEKR